MVPSLPQQEDQPLCLCARVWGFTCRPGVGVCTCTDTQDGRQMRMPTQPIHTSASLHMSHASTCMSSVTPALTCTSCTMHTQGEHGSSLSKLFYSSSLVPRCPLQTLQGYDSIHIIVCISTHTYPPTHMHGHPHASTQASVQHMHHMATWLHRWIQGECSVMHTIQ